MRYSITTDFAAADAAWQAAYAKHDAFAEAGDDGVRSGGSKEADDASTAEWDALHAVMSFPAVTPGEISRKIAIMNSDRFDGADIDDELAQIQRDLLALSRPAASPEIAGAITVYLLRLQTEAEADTKEEERAHAARCDALRHLYSLPCFTAGDFLVKAYAELLDSEGGTNRPAVPNGAHFEPEPGDGIPDGHSGNFFLDTEAKLTVRRDLLDCDLGRCLIGLGRVDFDAAAWLTLADRANADVSVVIQPDGTRGLYIGEDVDSEPNGIVQERSATLAALSAFDSEKRTRLIIDAIVKMRPHRVAKAEGAAAVADVVLEAAL